MSNEPSTIVYRSDYVRPGELTAEKIKTREQRHAIYERNRRKATAPDHCWGCIEFTEGTMSDRRNCERWRLDK